MWRRFNKALGWKREGAPCLDLLSCMRVPLSLHFSLSLECIGSKKKKNKHKNPQNNQNHSCAVKGSIEQAQHTSCKLDLLMNATGRSKPGWRETIQGHCLMISSVQRGSASRETASHRLECCTQGWKSLGHLTGFLAGYESAQTACPSDAVVYTRYCIQPPPPVQDQLYLQHL